eukprot:1149983-Pelagomonas_calceolata.AAC.5
MSVHWIVFPGACRETGTGLACSSHTHTISKCLCTGLFFPRRAEKLALEWSRHELPGPNHDHVSCYSHRRDMRSLCPA